jgi:hypothetical protein
MRKVIYANTEHEVLVSTYIQLSSEFAKEVSSTNKYNNYIEVLDIIFQYHNDYGKGTDRQNWYDWIMIIPINLTVMTNGFFAGIENKNNKSRISSYKILLNDMLDDIVTKIEAMEFKSKA